MNVSSENIDESLKILDSKLGQLKLAFEQYFLGTRPREPVPERREVEKAFLQLTNTTIQNTALRFRFRSLSSKYQAFKRQWDDTLRKIENGTYSRHRFKADLHDRDRSAAPGPAPVNAAGSGQNMGELFDAYREAARGCGQDIAAMSQQKLERALNKQRTALRERFGDENFRFKVVVKEGRVQLRAARDTDPSAS